MQLGVFEAAKIGKDGPVRPDMPDADGATLRKLLPNSSGNSVIVLVKYYKVASFRHAVLERLGVRIVSLQPPEASAAGAAVAGPQHRDESVEGVFVTLGSKSEPVPLLPVPGSPFAEEASNIAAAASAAEAAAAAAVETDSADAAGALSAAEAAAAPMQHAGSGATTRKRARAEAGERRLGAALPEGPAGGPLRAAARE